MAHQMFRRKWRLTDLFPALKIYDDSKKMYRYRRGSQNFACEVLEDRRLLSAVSWSGPSTGGDWGTPGNWSSGMVPTAADDVTIGQGISLTHVQPFTNDAVNSLTSGNDDLLDISGGSIAFTAASNLVNVNLSGGLLVPSAPLSITGNVNWTGGGFSGTATTTLAPSSTLAISGAGGKFLENGELVNAGAANWSGSNNSINMGGTPAATFTNSGTFAIQGDITLSGLGNFFRNTGTFTSSGGTALFRSTFDNSGSVSVTSGTLSIRGGTESGAFTAASGAAVNFSLGGTTILNAGTSFAGAGTYGFVDQFTQINLNTAITLQNLNVQIGFGTGLSGNGSLTVTKNFDYLSGDTFTTINIANTATLNISGTSSRTVSTGGVINNAGNAIWSGTGGLSLNGGGIINNTGTFNITNDLTDGAGGTFNNIGTLNKTAGAGDGISHMTWAFNNSGTVNVNSGGVEVQAGGAANSGTFNTVAGTSVIFEPGNLSQFNTYTLNAGTHLNGPGQYSLVSSFSNLDVPADVTVQNFKLDCAFSAGLSGAGTFTVTGTFDWANGEMSGSGVTSIPAGAVLILSGDGGQRALTNHRVLNNAGTIRWTGTSPLAGSPGSVINNSGTFDDQVDSTFGDGGFGGGVVLNNSGLFIKSAGTDFTIFQENDINNTGTVEVDSGVVTFGHNITQLSGGVLSAGTWKVLNGAQLIFPSAVTTNAASVTLGGAGATLGALAALSINSGTLSVVSGASLTTSATLTNTGTLLLGAGSTLTATGGFTQSTNGALNVQIGGPPSGSLFGKLISSGPAALDGTLNITIASGFGPTFGDQYTILTFPNRAGTFASITSPPGAPFGLAANPTNIVVTAQGMGVSLDVTSVTFSIPSTQAGQSASITYAVKNDTNNAATVDSWEDSVYLSQSTTLDVSAKLLARVPHTGGIAGSGSYTGMVTANLPALADGAYHVIVVADSRSAVPATDRTQTTGASAATFSVALPILVPGTPVQGSIRDGQDLYYRIDLAANATVRLALATGSATGVAEVYEQSGALPDFTTSDQFIFDPSATTQTLILPAKQFGSYFILLHGRAGAGQGATFALSAEPLPFQIISITPASGSNVGTATITVRGAGFSSATTVSLISASGGTVRAATSVARSDSGTIFATFDLTGLAAGSYNVRADDGAQSATATSAFTVTSGKAGELRERLTVPAVVRIFRTGVIVIEVANVGETDMPAPIFTLTADKALLQLPGESAFGSGTRTFQIVDADGPIDVLPPGFYGTISITFSPSTITPHDTIHFQLVQGTGVATANNAPRPAPPPGAPLQFPADPGPPPFPELPPTGGGGIGGHTDPRTPNDPNDIIGPAGIGALGLVGQSQILPYMIEFENQPTASAPAQDVTVTQQLDSSLDLSTFQLGDFGFGAITVHVPAGRSSFSTRVDARSASGLIVDVTANLNFTTRTVTWTFTSLDPVTLDQPSDPLAGFLPADDSTGRGQGFVTYTIRARAGQASGTPIPAQASVVFDQNAALATPAISNALDTSAPTSRITALEPITDSTAVILNWSGADNIAGSGIVSYDVFVSDNGGAFTSFLTGTSGTSATFTAQTGHTYRFYTLATDAVGNIESTKSSGDTAVTVLTGKATAILVPSPVNPSKKILAVFGTPAGDKILLTFTKGKIFVTIGKKKLGPFAPTAGIVVFGGAGNDSISLDTQIKFPATVHGGAGNDTIIGGGAAANRLSGDAGNDKITSQGTNDLLDGGDGNDTLIAGAGSQTLLGGNGNDALTGGKGSDQLIGGAGNDKLIAAGTNDILFGGDGNDILIGAAGHGIFSGGAGSDTITAAKARSILFGGSGTDKLNGNAQDDILVAGPTTFDNDLAALRAILAEWTRANVPYATRISHLQSGNGLNGANLLTSATVSNDINADILTGNAGQDWFVFSTGDKVKDRQHNETSMRI